MFENLSGRLQGVIKNLRGQARLTEDNIADAMREVRMALLEADVALPVVKDFIAQVKERAQGREVLQSLTPGQAVIQVVHEELTKLMGTDNAALNLAAVPPAQPGRARLAQGRAGAPGRLLRAPRPAPLLRRDPLRPHPRPRAAPRARGHPGA